MLHQGGLADIGRGLAGQAGVDGPAVLQQIQVAPAEHIHVGVPEALQGAHVLPVAVEAVGDHLLAGGQELGDDVLAEVIAGLGIGLVLNEGLTQLLPGENIDAHGGQVALGLLGLLLELNNVVLAVHGHDAEAGSLIPGHLQHGDGAGGLGLLVGLQHPVVVHLVNVVAGEDHHVLRVIHVHKADVLIDGVGGSLEPGALVALPHVGGQNVDAAVQPVQIPGLAGADVAVELQGLVLGEHTHGVDAGVGAVGQGEVNNAVLAAEGHGGLGHVAGQHVQTAALPPCQEHCNTLFFHVRLILPLS